MCDQLWNDTHQVMFAVALVAGWSRFALLPGSLASARHANPCGGGVGPQPTAALVLQPDSRSALAASQELQDVDTEQGPS